MSENDSNNNCVSICIPKEKSSEQESVNPFEHNVRFTAGQKIQIAFMSMTIAPLRMILLLMALFASWLFALVISIGVPLNVTKPAGPIRHAFYTMWVKFFRLVFFFIGFHRIQVEGRRATEEEAPILVAGPHSSMMDLVVFCSTSPILSGLSAMVNQDMPILKTLGKILQPIYVRRTDHQSRKETVQAIVDRVNDPSAGWPQLVVFPEGTTTNRRALIKFKPGAFIPGVPVQPVLMHYREGFDTVTWTMGSFNSLSLLWLNFCQFSIETKVTYLPVYNPNEKEKADALLYANNVRQMMSEHLGVTCTEHTYEDCRLAYKAESLNMSWEAGLVEFHETSTRLNMSFEEMEKKFEEFVDIVTDRKSGLLPLDDFGKHYGLPITSALLESLDITSSSPTKHINFRQYLIAMTFVEKHLAIRKLEDSQTNCAVISISNSLSEKVLNL